MFKSDAQPEFFDSVRNVQNSGILNLGFKNLTASDLMRILQSLPSSDDDADARERRPRKCRRLEGIDYLIESLRELKQPIWKVNLVGNDSLGDEAAELLHLLPSSVIKLDLSHCGLSSKGIGRLCQFMRTNHTITSLSLWGNPGLEEQDVPSAFSVGQSLSSMLTQNNTLEELYTWPSKGELSDDTVIDLASSLTQNTALRFLELSQDSDLPGLLTDSPFSAAQQRKSRTLAMFLRSNRTLQRLRFGGFPHNDLAGGSLWEETLLENDTLVSICGEQLTPFLSECLVSLLEANKAGKPHSKRNSVKNPKKPPSDGTTKAPRNDKSPPR